MFFTARVKLTVWYTVIIMGISVLFSVAIFNMVSHQLEKGFRIAQIGAYAQRNNLPLPPGFHRDLRQLDPQLKNINFEEMKTYFQYTQRNVVKVLVAVNGLIFVISIIGGFILSGVTLRPIKIAMEEQTEFVSNVSHELRTPITVLRTAFEVNIDNPKNSTRVKKLYEDSLQQVIRLEKLANRLLQLLQYPATYSDQDEKIDLGETINQVIQGYISVAKKNNISLRFQTRKNVFINGNETSIKELLGIFLDNSFKFTPSKGKVFVKIEANNNQAIISISDTGIGIKKEDISHIFDRFYQVKAARSKATNDGYGLGLSLAKKIVEYHKGRIEVESQINNGTTFTIFIPKA